MPIHEKEETARQNLALYLRNLRRQQGLTQGQLAARLERPQSYVAKYESVRAKLGAVELIYICRGLGVDARDVFNTLYEGA